MTPDFVIADTCIVLLMLKDYFHRVSKKGMSDETIPLALHEFHRKVLFLQLEGCTTLQAMVEVQTSSIRRGFALVCLFTPAELNSYLEAFSAASSVSKRATATSMDTGPLVPYVLSSIKSVCKSDVIAFQRNFTCISDVLRAKERALSLVPGIGSKKIQRMRQSTGKPFLGS